MALPTLDATFASSVDLPRRQMLARWLVEELGSGSIADYYDLPERYLWAKIAVAAGGPKTEVDYISLPKNYAWSDIYNAVAFPSFPNAELLAFWKLADLTDASGNGNSLTNTNSVAFVAGKIGNAAVFNGSNYLRSTIIVDLDLEFCISLWCKPDNTANYGTMVGGSAGGTINIAYTGANSFDFNNGAAGHINVAATPSVWQHLVFNSDGTTDQAWVNGVLVDERSAQGRSPTTRIDLGSLTNSYFYFGQLDAVGIWSRDLTSGEIAQLYNNGSGLEP